MKLLASFVLITLSLMTFCKEKKSEQIQIPNFYPTPPIGYQNVPNSHDILTHAAGFVSPTYLDRIPTNLNSPYGGVIETPNTSLGPKVYYNGQNNISAIHVECNAYRTVPQGCTQHQGCGWCGEKNSCIPGTPAGPLAPCLRNTFLFTAPSAEWNPFNAGTINVATTDSKQRPQTILAATPDMSLVDVHNPYK